MKTNLSKAKISSFFLFLTLAVLQPGCDLLGLGELQIAEKNDKNGEKDLGEGGQPAPQKEAPQPSPDAGGDSQPGKAASPEEASQLAEPNELVDESPLPVVSASKVGIVNLGATCFLNSFFKHMLYNNRFPVLLEKHLVRQDGESSELFAARQSLQTSLRAVFRFLSTHAAERDTTMPGSYTRNFIRAWNRIFAIEQQQASFLVGLAEPLHEKKQADASEVLRYVLIALDAPKLAVMNEYTALDPVSYEELPGLSKKQQMRAEDVVVRLSLGERGAEQRYHLRGLLEDSYGVRATTLLTDLATWLYSGESEQKHTARLKLWIAAADSQSLSLVIEDRLYAEFPDPTLRKNRAYLEIPQLIHLPIWPDQQAGSGSPDQGQGHWSQRDQAAKKRLLRLRSVIVHEGGGSSGHYYTVSSERQVDGSYRLVTHDDRRVAVGFNLESMARGARVVHYEAVDSYPAVERRY